MNDNLPVINNFSSPAAYGDESIIRFIQGVQSRLAEVYYPPKEVLRRRQIAGGAMHPYAPHDWYRKQLFFVLGGPWNYDWRSTVTEELDTGQNKVFRVVTGTLTVFFPPPFGPRGFAGTGDAEVRSNNRNQRLADLDKAADSLAFVRACQVFGIGQGMMEREEDVAETAKNLVLDGGDPFEAYINTVSRLKTPEGTFRTRAELQERLKERYGGRSNKELTDAERKELTEEVVKLTNLWRQQKQKEGN